ncbi:MAG: GPR endopeptidase [Clostridia bacterium]|nr:GPR endopeptidase [Clostridia bacterium]
MNIRTDLAYESYGANQADSIPGVAVTESHHPLYGIHRVSIISREGSETLGKPPGNYVTLELAKNYKYDPQGVETLFHALGEMLTEFIPKEGSCLIAGLGNASITADAIGPRVLHHLLITRHLMDALPDSFPHLRCVAALAPGVLGTTGIESGDMIRAIVKEISPDFIVCIDALAAADPSRLLTTIQLCDTGLVPGSGIGNTRASLTPDALGIPVIAMGVPTVIYADTILKNPQNPQHELIVTPKEIDQAISDLSKLMGYGLNLALHPGLTLSDVTHFLS